MEVGDPLVGAILEDEEKAQTTWSATVTWNGGFRSEAKIREFDPIASDEPELGEALMRSAVTQARSSGFSSVSTKLPPWSPWFDRFQRWGFLAHASGEFLMSRSFVRKYDDLWLRDNWWVTFADSSAV